MVRMTEMALRNLSAFLCHPYHTDSEVWHLKEPGIPVLPNALKVHIDTICLAVAFFPLQ